MPYDMILPSRKIIVSRDNVIDPPMKISSIVFEEKEMFRKMSLKFQLASFLSSFGICVETHIERDNNVCYQVKSGFFYDMLIFISFREETLLIIFKVDTYEQGYTLQKLSPGIAKKLSAGCETCKVEVVLENRRL
ncbi:TPA: hypothetical protein JDD34_001043 [Salmonella enterica subsp. diarizonae]|nr:hypothetical protein [Salmonella enterica subsp. diarizonae]